MQTLNRADYNRSNTYTYSDSQVIAIFRYGIVAGAITGAAVVYAIMQSL